MKIKIVVLTEKFAVTENMMIESRKKTLLWKIFFPQTYTKCLTSIGSMVQRKREDRRQNWVQERRVIVCLLK